MRRYEHYDADNRPQCRPEHYSDHCIICGEAMSDADKEQAAYLGIYQTWCRFCLWGYKLHWDACPHKSKTPEGNWVLVSAEGDSPVKGIKQFSAELRQGLIPMPERIQRDGKLFI